VDAARGRAPSAARGPNPAKSEDCGGGKEKMRLESASDREKRKKKKKE
jgi:hypothetical protein